MKILVTGAKQQQLLFPCKHSSVPVEKNVFPSQNIGTEIVQNAAVVC